MELDLNPRILNLLTRQLYKVAASPPEGVTPVINEENLSEIQADITGPEATPYYGGTFRVKLELPSDFPTSPPKGYFLTKIWHPNISPGGEICVNTLKKDWNPKTFSLFTIYQVIRCLLVEPFPASALNEEAGRMFMEDYQNYFQHAQLYTSIHAMPKKKLVKVPKVQTHLEKLKKWLRR
mmetsp:Transcript_13395/g.19561  ORF Transcript_13395/g.19561 Transcript_13395/m.19561 type:complete len:180 (+) Transcript_13395:46-585(+)